MRCGHRGEGCCCPAPTGPVDERDRRRNPWEAGNLGDISEWCRPRSSSSSVIGVRISALGGYRAWRCGDLRWRVLAPLSCGGA